MELKKTHASTARKHSSCAAQNQLREVILQLVVSQTIPSQNSATTEEQETSRAFRFPAEKLCQATGLEVLDDDISALKQMLHDILALFGLEVDSYTVLVPVAAREVCCHI